MERIRKQKQKTLPLSVGPIEHVFVATVPVTRSDEEQLHTERQRWSND